LIVAAITGFGADGAFAGDLVNGSEVPRYLLFSGFDLWRAGGFAHGGVLWSPNGLSRDGFTFKLLVGGGRYQYRSGLAQIRGDQLLGAAMPGWRFVRDHTELTVYAGIDVESHRLSPNDPFNNLRGQHAGLRVGGDFWSEPVNAFMVTASASAATVGSNIWTRVAAGWRAFDCVWIGPEVQMFGDGHYRELRAGGHVTAFRTGRFEWSAGFGYAVDSDHRAGPYGRIGLLTRQ
jgi:hypothetical protein